MAVDYQALLDMLKPKEEEPMMSQVSPEQTTQPQAPAQEPMVPVEMPKQQTVQPQQAMVQDPATELQRTPGELASPLSAQEQLLEQYKRLVGREETDQKRMEEARRSDRMLKVGGALGDALATYLNAQGQMNVKAPGVQVQQGAGLGKVADMFATVPEIASDIADKRKLLLEQYKQLASEEENKLDRALKERQVAAYEAQTKAQSRKAELEARKDVKKEEEKLTVGEETLDREFAKKLNNWSTQGKADYEENSKILKDAITKLDKGTVSTGFTQGIAAKIPGIRTETRELETRVRKALNGMLRATLGAQFTQEEGERIFQQTFDPAASPDENVKNMQTELQKLEKQKKLIEDQGSFFKKNKTLRGYELPQTLEEPTQNQTQLSPKDQQALDWANKNSNDPRAAAIKKRLGM
jgi:hypothetical protein